jgi:PAX-interacting protein 1
VPHKQTTTFFTFLQGKTFYLTPSISPPWRDLKRVIEHAGGAVDNKRRKTVEEISQLNRPGQDPTYLLITCEHDLHIVADVLKAKIGVYNTEFVMSAVLSGRINFDLSQSLMTF